MLNQDQDGRQYFADALADAQARDQAAGQPLALMNAPGPGIGAPPGLPDDSLQRLAELEARVDQLNDRILVLTQENIVLRASMTALEEWWH